MRISNSIAELRQQIHDDLRISIPNGSRQMANLPRVIPMRRASWNSSWLRHLLSIFKNAEMINLEGKS